MCQSPLKRKQEYFTNVKQSTCKMFHCATTFEMSKECHLTLKKGSAVPDVMCVDVGLADPEKA